MFELNSKRCREFWETAFHHGTRAKAERVVAEGRIVYWNVNRGPGAWEITAKVSGSAPQPYDVKVLCGDMMGRPFIKGRCSCPMLENCKHVLAAVLRALGSPPKIPQPAVTLMLPDAGPASKAIQVPSLPNPVSPPPKPKPETSVHLSRDWTQWIGEMRKAAIAEARQADESRPKMRLLYVLKPAARSVPLEFAIEDILPGVSSRIRPVRPFEVFSGDLHEKLAPEERRLLRRIMFEAGDRNPYNAALKGSSGAELLTDLLATGQCRWKGSGKTRPALRLGPPRQAKPEWKMDQDGVQRPSFQITPQTAVTLPFSPPWYLDEVANLCGPLETGLPAEAAGQWLFAPSLRPEESALVHEQLPQGAGWSLPAPAPIPVERLPLIDPVPCLRLYSEVLPRARSKYAWDEDESEPGDEDRCNLAHLDFDYAGVRLEREGPAIVPRFQNGKLNVLERNATVEAAAVARLEEAELCNLGDVVYSIRGQKGREFACEEESEWFRFVSQVLPKLRAEGWRIEIDPSFTCRLVEPEAWYADAQAAGGLEWFDAEIGIQLEGQKINLLPVLLREIQSAPELLSRETLKKLKDGAEFLLTLDDGRKVPFPVGRLKTMLGVLLDLYNPQALDAAGRLRLPKLRAAELSGTADGSWRWLGGETLRALSDKLRNFRSIQPVAAPAGLQATLRPYQQEGFNWLQFLREYQLCGILADDMGLGKTIQTLAHLLHEKNSGRADIPSLVVAPTSLMTNWRQETERFAPELKLLVLHGQDRKQHFEKLRDFDLVITTYALLPRDEAVLLKEQFHIVVLDEAQYIKNPKTKYAQIACQMRARHHLCLTGTPMENHLGELWSQFNFLLPGFLGDETRFRKVFRNPIEQGADEERRLLLARRIAPFVLRRRKDQVATELPPKTEIVHNVELEGAQRDLYETIRLAMHQKVRAEVDKKGLSRAHIIILDALLKLRQVCCDPRLVKLDAARAVGQSAKLELLMDLLPQMLAEGRRILLFSQFTSMLALIEKELAKENIKYSLLTGETINRAHPIEQFQKGQVPLFLISLKAGGTGLNLTAADTVIHYDPWWNPAVENQATDRAHRIGQTKSVFVYKLMTVGTVEEKILALQKRKRELVESLMDEGRKENLQLTAEDLQVLFAPIG
jgi:superfamily II DNA or RNA helicase